MKVEDIFSVHLAHYKDKMCLNRHKSVYLLHDNKITISIVSFWGKYGFFNESQALVEHAGATGHPATTNSSNGTNHASLNGRAQFDFV